MIPSLAQLENKRKRAVRRARALLDRPSDSSRVNLTCLVLCGKSVKFSKDISRIEVIVPSLREQQTDGDNKQLLFCLGSIDRIENGGMPLATAIKGQRSADNQPNALMQVLARLFEREHS